MAKRSIVGDLINFRGFVYGPVNEMGVVALFAKLSEELGFIIEEVRAEFPDCIARRQVDKGWERVAVEFEFKSSSFRQHEHDPDACDLIVCWEHDWESCPVPVLELKPYIADAQANVSGPLNRVRIADPVEIRKTTLTRGGIKNGYINIKPLDEFWPEESIGDVARYEYRVRPAGHPPGNAGGNRGTVRAAVRDPASADGVVGVARRPRAACRRRAARHQREFRER